METAKIKIDNTIEATDGKRNAGIAWKITRTKPRTKKAETPMNDRMPNGRIFLKLNFQISPHKVGSLKSTLFKRSKTPALEKKVLAI